jgi:hypothetical protein
LILGERGVLVGLRLFDFDVVLLDDGGELVDDVLFLLLPEDGPGQVGPLL